MTNIDSLIAQLTRGDRMARRAAARALIDGGSAAAVPALIAALDDGDPLVRLDAVTALGTCSDEAGMAALIRLATQAQIGALNIQAIRVLGWQRDQRLTGVLLPLLAHGINAVRLAAAEALGESGDPSAVPALMERLERDPQPDIRWQAARALGSLRAPSAVPALIAALHDADPTLRGCAAAALGAIGDRRALHALRAAAGDPHDGVRRAVMAALGVIDGAR
jgi:HEAT repeat protein